MKSRRKHLKRFMFVVAITVLCDAWTGGLIIESIFGGYKPKPRQPPSRTESTGGRKSLSSLQ